MEVVASSMYSIPLQAVPHSSIADVFPGSVVGDNHSSTRQSSVIAISIMARE